MAHPDTVPSRAPDDKLDGLVRAIAAELIQLGYQPTEEPGNLLSRSQDFRAVDPAIWKAMKDIQAGREP